MVKQYVNINARGKLMKGFGLQKVLGHRIVVKDCFNELMTTTMEVFKPKLVPRQPRPVSMFSMYNGKGTCYYRQENNTGIAKQLRELADILTSNEWLEKEQILEDIADTLVYDGEVLLDSAFVDVGSFKRYAGFKKKEKGYPGLTIVEKS